MRGSIRVRILVLLVTLPALLQLAGCGPRLDRFHYIRLEPVAGLSIVERGEVDLRGLFGAGPLPLRYELRRDAYAVTLAVVANSYLPAMRVEIDTAGLEIRARRDTGLRSGAGLPCASVYPDHVTGGAMIFGWSPACDSATMPRRLSFDVLSADGELLGREDLAFTLPANGWYVQLDAV